jgi:hypothetical protein
MRTGLRRTSLAASLFALTFTAASQPVDCPNGNVPTFQTLPNGQTQVVCLPPRAIDGQGNAPGGSPFVPAQCPCFSLKEVTVAVRDSGFSYTYVEGAYVDPNGEPCKYKEVRTTRTGTFAAMMKIDAPHRECVVKDLFPVTEVNPNGCYRQNGTGTLILNPISPAESTDCAGILTEFNPGGPSPVP